MPFTALTRPRISTGVRNCTSENRITTLTTSAAPITASAASDSTRWADRPNTISATPNTVSTPNTTLPTGIVSGQRASVSDVKNAPTPGAACTSSAWPR